MSSVTLKGALALGGGTIGLGIWRSWVHSAAQSATSAILQGSSQALLEFGWQLGEPIYTGGYYLICVYIIFELRAELISVGRLLVRICLWLVHLFSVWWDREHQRDLRPLADTERDSLGESDLYLITCHPMALDGFVLAERSGEWDEIWVAGVVPDTSDLIARSTSEDGSEWIWTLVRCDAMSLRPPTGLGVHRAAPQGVVPDTVNWICAPQAMNQKWAPSAAEIASLKQEAALLGLHIKRIGLTENQVTIPGRGMSLIPLVLQPAAVEVAAPASRVDAGGLGPTQRPGPSGDPFNLQSLADVVQELKDMAQKKEEPPKHKGKRKRTRKRRKRRSVAAQAVQMAADQDRAGPVQAAAAARALLGFSNGDIGEKTAR